MRLWFSLCSRQPLSTSLSKLLFLHSDCPRGVGFLLFCFVFFRNIWYLLCWSGAQHPFKVCFCVDHGGTVCRFSALIFVFKCNTFLVTHLHTPQPKSKHTATEQNNNKKKTECGGGSLDRSRPQNMKMTGFLLVSQLEHRHVLVSPFLALSNEFSSTFHFPSSISLSPR